MRFWCVPLLVITALPGVCQRSDWNLRDHIPLDQVIVQSHRGAGELMPENSLEAFELGWRVGTIPEADLRTTRDGIIVAFHDENFRHILPSASPEMQKRGIKDLDWAEVSALDIGAWKGTRFAGQRVASLSAVSEVLRKNPRRRLYIDIKNVDLEQLARESRAAGVAARLILASTDYTVIRTWKKLAPESSTIHWMGGPEEVLAQRIADLRKTNFADIDQLQIHVRESGGTMRPSAEFLLKTGAELRSYRILFQTLPFGSKDPALFRRLMDLGCASFATDYPDVMMNTIREYYAARH
ncbi:MAG: glycerophosphodiester phosphodiesterase family protein [Bryobacteraceae bacterium]